MENKENTGDIVRDKHSMTTSWLRYEISTAC